MLILQNENILVLKKFEVRDQFRRKQRREIVTEHYCAENNCAGDCAVFEKLRRCNFSKTAQSPAQLFSAQ